MYSFQYQKPYKNLCSSRSENYDVYKVPEFKNFSLSWILQTSVQIIENCSKIYIEIWRQDRRKYTHKFRKYWVRVHFRTLKHSGKTRKLHLKWILVKCRALRISYSAVKTLRRKSSKTWNLSKPHPFHSNPRKSISHFVYLFFHNALLFAIWKNK